MDRIAEIDKSLYFKNYYSEIINRLDVIDRRNPEKEMPWTKGMSK